ncbi:hypothetical protein ACSLVQ_30735, partial [Klebsiella pneumoniae]|uniref:hypothetical protein n=1 Tax=Klebsiella pneumoniae TaxID=573 RepID=UPI003EDF88B5
PHMPHSLDSRARRAVASLLQQRGAGPRRYRNTLVFLAPDQTRLLGLQQVVREYLAWRGIAEEGQMQNLDPAQC